VVIAYLDFIWALVALLYDLGKLASISWFLWPLVVICPLFPFLLGLVFLEITKKSRPNQFLLASAGIASATFGALALLFYPLIMFNEGFSWAGFGQILWVLFYGLQGWYLVYKYKVGLGPILVAGIYLIGKLTLDYFYLSFGYLAVEKLTAGQLLGLYVAGLAVVVVVCLIAGRTGATDP